MYVVPGVSSLKFHKTNLKLFKYLHPKLMKLAVILAIISAAAAALLFFQVIPAEFPVLQSESEDTIKWVDFDVPYNLLEKTMYLDIESY